MYTLTASNLDGPPPKINHPPSSSPSLFSSLPYDIILDILARVPKRCYPILSCVSKKFQILVRSPDIQKMRSLLGKDSLHICLGKSNWFILRRKKKKNPSDENLFSINGPFLRKKMTKFFFVIPVGPEIFIIRRNRSVHSPSLFIFDSRSRKYRPGPNMQGELLIVITVALVGNKIYVIGRGRGQHKDELRATFFDLKTQTWEQTSIFAGQIPSVWMRVGVANNIALDRKVCWVSSERRISCYNTKDDSCESFEFANEEWCSRGMCVIDNVLYVYYKKLGLMWYESKVRQWRMVNGLDHLNLNEPVGMSEYYGKLAYIWTKSDGVVDKKQIWCRMIALNRNDQVGIHGTEEPSQLLGIVPSSASLRQCLSLST